MHKTSSNLQTVETSQTTGNVLHQASGYDRHSNLMGMGVSGSNSRMIVEMAKIKAGDRVLDVGCGSGNLTLAASKSAGHSGSVYGIDPSPEMIAVARQKAQGSGLKAAFDVGLIEQLAFPDAAFEVVICRLMLHHLPDDLKRRGFAEILRVLKPGGLFFAVDFKPPTNPILAHLALVLVGHKMMMASGKIGDIPPMLAETGFVEVASGPTRSALMAFVSGRKPGR